MELRDAIYRRRAVRDFTDRPVSSETIESLLDAATHAPSAVNAQPWAFAVVQGRERLKELSDRAKTALVQAGDLLAAHPELRTMVADPDFNIFYNASTLIVICAKPIGLHPDWDCYLAGQNLMLYALDQGLGTCPIGLAWTLLEQPDVKRDLRIPDVYRPVLPLIVGYPAHDPPTTVRNPPEILR